MTGRSLYSSGPLSHSLKWGVEAFKLEPDGVTRACSECA